MLQAIREKAQGWIAWVIVILISIPFALWGIQEYLGIGGEPVVVKVNGNKITERDLESRFQDFRRQLRQQLGDSYRAGVIDDKKLKRQVLDSMIRSQLLLQAARDQHMQVSEEMLQRTIVAVPAFQRAGKFDFSAYERNLNSQGMTSEMFRQTVRGSMVVEQLTVAINGSEFTTPSELKELVRLKDQKREVAFLRFPVEAYQRDDPIDQTKIEHYYREKQADFMAPERVKLEYVELNPETLSNQVKVDDDDLKAYLDSHSDEFRLPQEYHVSHILVNVKNGKDAEARKKAEKLLARVNAGEDFAKLAKSESNDPGSASAGGDLGFFGKEVMEPAFNKAVATLKPGEISPVVRDKYGYHIIRLHETRGGGKADLASVRDRVAEAYKNEKAQKLYYEYADLIPDLAFDTPDSLAPLVEELKIPLKTTDWVTRAGGEGFLSSPKVLGAAFSEDVLVAGNNSEPIEVDRDHVVVLRVVAHEAAAVKPLDEVRDEIEAALKLERAEKAAAKAGQAALDKLAKNAAFDSLADAGKKIVLNKAKLLDRFSMDAPQGVLQKAFQLPHPTEGKPSYAGAKLENGDYAVMMVTKVKNGVVVKGKENELTAKQLARARGDHYEELFVNALHQRADIEYLQKIE